VSAQVQPNGGTDGWRARLQLGYELRDATTILAENSHQGPLRVQQPLYPEGGICHTCILHPPGGVVGGDHLELRLKAAQGAHALITTPGATKFYRSGGRRAAQHQYLDLQNSRVEWFPQDSIVFPGAEAEIITEIRLTGTAAFIGWEVVCLGLPTRGERFAHGSLKSRIGLYRDGRPLFLERLAVSGTDDLDSPAGLRGFPVTATMLATGVDVTRLNGLSELLPVSGATLAAMTLMEDLLVIRCLAASTFEAREIFQAIWLLLRPRLFGCAPCPPRIWST